MIGTILAVLAALIAIGILVSLIAAEWLAVAVLFVALAVLAPLVPIRGN